MKFCLLLGILSLAIAGHGAELNSSITSVDVSKGLTYSATDSNKFPSIDAAQKFANENKLNEITLRINLNLSAEKCGFNLPALALGDIYDQDLAVFNGQLIGSTGNPQLSSRRLSLIPRVYPIPKQILKCPGENQLDLSLKRILGGWIGPFSGSIELGELHELQQKAMVAEAWGPLLQRDIGILLFAISLLLISLFYRYPDNYRQTAFVAFSFSAALLCLSLSGWYYRYFDFPQAIFRLHFAFVSLALSTQILFVAAYRGLRWAKDVSRPLFFLGCLTVFTAISFSIGSVGVLLNIYLVQLLVLIVASLAIYLLPVLAPKRFRVGREFNYGIEASLFLVHFGSSMDIARIWKLHNFENISPYTYGMSLFVIGSILASELVRVFQKAAQTADAESQLKQSKRQAEFSRQVAHDMRSPLSALNMMVTMLTDVPEDRRLIIRNSAQRINDIANSLLHRSWSSKIVDQPSPELITNTVAPNQVIMLSSLVDSIVSEKRVQYRDRHDVDIAADLNTSYGLFSAINPTDIARALSNLIDNSVEASNTSTNRILILVEADVDSNRIVVADNGKGISAEVIDRVGTPGTTFGKNGSGLGLYQAKLAVQSSGGTLTIDSNVGKGTSVTLVLPKAMPPAWFLSHLTVSPGSQLISVDDDQTVHQIWDSRLRGLNGQSPQHMAFTTIAQFEEWYSANGSKTSQFLVDFEFLGHPENGLQVIERLNITKEAILVSSRAEDHHIQVRAIALGIKLLPKALAPLVPIVVAEA